MPFGKNKPTYNCCGGIGKCLNGCEGEVHESYGGAQHSYEISLSPEEFRKYKEDGGKFIRFRKDRGNIVITVKDK